MKIKPHSNSVISGLTPENRQLLNEWLFKENVSYSEASRRCLEHFKLNILPASLVRYYRRQETERVLNNIAGSANQATALAVRFKDDKFCEAFSVLMGQLAFETALSGAPAVPDEIPSADNELPEAGDTSNPPRVREPGRLDAVSEAAAIFTNALKLKFAKQSHSLEREKFELELQKYKDHTAEQKRKIESALTTGKRKGGISEELLREIEEAANLL